MKYMLTLVFLITIISCNKEPEKNNTPLACFTWSPDDLIQVGDTVQFMNCSENSYKFLWVFGDGETCAERDPIHRFSTIGKLEVTLIAFGNDRTNTLIRSISVADGPDRILFSNLYRPISRFTVRSFRWVDNTRYPGYWPTPQDSSTFLSLDVDNDGEEDFMINLSHHPAQPPYYGSGDGYTYYIGISGLNESDSIAYTSSPGVAGYFTESGTIPFKGTWSAKGVLVLKGSPMEFSIKGDYIGFKHKRTVGWIKIKAMNNNGISVENYAVNLAGGKSIRAGQKE